MATKQKPTFVLSPQCPATILSSSATQPGSLVLAAGSVKPGLPLARLSPFFGSGLVGHLLPFARIAGSQTSLYDSLFSDDAEQQNVAPRRGHNDEWYQERCVFCAACKIPVNSTYEKTGSKCHGCRRWFHSTCNPWGSQQEQSATAVTEGANGGSISNAGELRRQSRGMIFHTEDCRQVYDRLAAVAAAGEQQLPVPAQRVFLPWQKQQQQQQQTWRLLDLADVRQLYKDAQRKGWLHKQHAKIKQEVAAYAAERLAASRSSSSSSNSLDSSQGVRPGVDASAADSYKRVIHTRLDDLLTVCELLKGLGDTPRDLLEDSFALITRNDRGVPLCAGTMNVYGADHARLQGLATPQHLQRRGHGSCLMRQLESVLQGAGVQQLVAILEPQESESSSNDRMPASAVERWLQRRLGYKPASSEQHMLWRRDLPEYHKNLTAGCTLLVKPLTLKQKGWW